MAVAEGNSVGSDSFTPPFLGFYQNENLEDRYILGEQLGWGQSGIIRRLIDKFTGEIWACKSIAKNRLLTVNDLQNVRLEIEIMTRLSGNPNVVHLKAVYEEEDHVHLVMELCAGGELFDKLDKHGRFSEEETRILFKQLMHVVLYCHNNGIVHRDLKPENILLATKSSSSPIKLADFGLATYIESGKSLHGTVGSPFYIAPEVLSGGYNQSADVWSAGVILYVLLSGAPPFWGKTKSQIFSAVRSADLQFPSGLISSSAKDLISRMLCTDPSQRLTAHQVLAHPWTTTEIMTDASFVINNGFMSVTKDISFCDFGSSSFGRRASSFAGEEASPPPPSASLFESDDGGFTFSTGQKNGTLELFHSLVSVSLFGRHDSTPVGRPDHSSLHLSREADERVADGKRVGELVVARSAGMVSRRNRTIGLGELEHFDMVVVDSVTRWVSCTGLLSTHSMRSSLVC